MMRAMASGIAFVISNDPGVAYGRDMLSARLVRNCRFIVSVMQDNILVRMFAYFSIHILQHQASTFVVQINGLSTFFYRCTNTAY